jgi:hypothetical protein
MVEDGDDVEVWGTKGWDRLEGWGGSTMGVVLVYIRMVGYRIFKDGRPRSSHTRVQTQFERRSYCLFLRRYSDGGFPVGNTFLR